LPSNFFSKVEIQPILQALSNINCLRRLDIGGNNLVALKRSSKPQHAAMVNKILLDIVKLYSDDSVRVIVSYYFIKHQIRRLFIISIDKKSSMIVIKI